MNCDINEIKKLDLFHGIKESDLPGMMSCIGGQIKTYDKGQFISLEADEMKWIHVVLSGTVHMLKLDIWGNETILSVIGENQLFGETFAGSSDPVASVSFRSAKNTRLLSIPFYRIMHTCTLSCVFHHRIIENMVSLIAEKNKQLMEKLAIVSQKTLRKKILAYLSVQAQESGSGDENNAFVIPLGRVELASYLNVDRSALTRELNNMKEDGIIDFSRNTFRLLE